MILAELLLNKRHLLPYESDQAMLGQIAGLCALEARDRALIPSPLASAIVPKGKSWSQLAAAKGLSGPAVDLVRRMLQVDPSRRPTLSEVISDATFAGVV
jgi:serine/threonine protein kinase